MEQKYICLAGPDAGGSVLRCTGTLDEVHTWQYRKEVEGICFSPAFAIPSWMTELTNDKLAEIFMMAEALREDSK